MTPPIQRPTWEAGKRPKAVPLGDVSKREIMQIDYVGPLDRSGGQYTQMVENELVSIAARLKQHQLQGLDVPIAMKPYWIYIYRTAKEHHEKTKEKTKKTMAKGTRKRKKPVVRHKGLRGFLQRYRTRKFYMKRDWLDSRRATKKPTAELVKRVKRKSFREILGFGAKKHSKSRQLRLGLMSKLAPIITRPTTRPREKKPRVKKGAHKKRFYVSPGRLRKATGMGMRWTGGLVGGYIRVEWGITEQELGAHGKLYNYAPVIEGKKGPASGGGWSPYARRVVHVIQREIHASINKLNTRVMSQEESEYPYFEAIEVYQEYSKKS